ncbi:MAG: MltA domain-containing protein, partial [Burkholderiales bacterium]|nr:MltA domain-containing protein [Burkholderiales bacterium]
MLRLVVAVGWIRTWRPARWCAPALILAVAACAPCPKCPEKPAPPTAGYERVDFADLPGWTAAATSDALRAFLAGCARVREASALAAACARARDVPPDEGAARGFFETTFTPYAVSSSTDGERGLITGYYEPVLEGSRTRSDAFRHPVFGVPPDMIVVDLASVYPDLGHRRLRGRVEGRRLVPYWSRAEIERDGGAFQAPVLAWVSDPVALFFLQIQGSGRIAFDDGAQLRLGYADQNGHPYRSLGRHLVERGELKLEEASMQGIQAWAAANPDKLRAALDANPSYVFFRELPDLPAQDGPIGALGVPLLARASLAVDRRFIPLGAPVYLATTLPLSDAPLEQLAVALDTGGAIRGPVRADYFWGSGPEAGALAGRMRQPGRLWLLWPRGAPLPA